MGSESLAELFVLKLLRRAEWWHWHSLFLSRALANRHQPWVLVDGRFGKFIQILICSMQLCEDLFATSLAKEFNSWVVQTLSLSFELKFDVAKPSQRLLLPISSGCLVLALEHLSFIFSLDFLGLVQLGADKWLTCFSWIAHLGEGGTALLEPKKQNKIDDQIPLSQRDIEKMKVIRKRRLRVSLYTFYSMPKSWILATKRLSNLWYHSNRHRLGSSVVGPMRKCTDEFEG